jgi:hypothetical protein
MDPQGRPILHRAQQERLKVQEHLVGPITIPGRLVGNDRCKVPIPAAVLHQRNGTVRMWFIWIGRDLREKEKTRKMDQKFDTLEATMRRCSEKISE